MSRRKNHLRRFTKRLLALSRHPFFWILTIAGNSAILIGSIFLYIFESSSGANGSLSYLDCLLWSTSTVTTVGYGSVFPVTTPGKIVLLFLMIFGTLFIWSYMGFLVSALIAPEMDSLEKEIREMERDLEALKNLK